MKIKLNHFPYYMYHTSFMGRGSKVTEKGNRVLGAVSLALVTSYIFAFTPVAIISNVVVSGITAYYWPEKWE